MSSQERGPSPSEQILNKNQEEKLQKRKESGALRGKVFLFEHSHAAYDPATGLIQIARSRSAEIEVAKDLVEVKFGLAGQMELPVAIAHVLHIVDDFELSGGDVTRRDRAVLDKALDVLEWWEDTPISEDNRQTKENEVDEVLESTKYSSSRDRHRKKIGAELSRGTHRDSLGRINPEAMKTLVAVAIRSGNMREDKNRIIFNKYGLQLLPDLIIEREEERKRLHHAMLRIEQVMRVPEPLFLTYQRKIKTLGNDLPGILSPWVVKIAPFNQPAAEALASLVPDLHVKNRTVIKKVLGDKKFEELRTRKARQLIKAIAAFRVYPKDARRVIDELLKSTYDNLGETLKKEQQTMNEEMEKRRIRLANEPQAIV